MFWRDHFVPAQRASENRPATLAYYDTFYRTHIADRFGCMPMRELSRGVVKAACDALAIAPVIRYGRTLRPRHSPATVRGLFATFQAILEEAVETNIIAANPLAGAARRLKKQSKKKGATAIDATRKTAKKVKAMDRAQLRTFLEAAETHASEFAGLCLFLARTGVRIGEALAVQWDDLDLDQRTLRIERAIARGEKGVILAPPKTDHGVRTVKLTRQLVERLRKGQEATKLEKLRLGWRDFSPWLFHGPQDPATYATETAGPSTARASGERCAGPSRLCR